MVMMMMLLTLMLMLMLKMMIFTSKVGSVLENMRRVASPSLGVCWRLMITFRCHHHDDEYKDAEEDLHHDHDDT